MSGLKCITNQNIGFSLTFASAAAATPGDEKQSFMVYLEEIRLNIGGTLGAPYSTSPELISFSSIVSGSIIASGNVDTSLLAPGSTYAAFSNMKPAGSYVGFALVSSSYVANGFTPPSSESSSINLPLVLGISIPSGILLIVIVVVVVVKLKKRNSIK